MPIKPLMIEIPTPILTDCPQVIRLLFADLKFLIPKTITIIMATKPIVPTLQSWSR